MHNNDRLRQEGAVMRQTVAGRKRRVLKRRVGFRTVPRHIGRGRVARVARLLGDDGRRQPKQLRLVRSVSDGPRVQHNAVFFVVVTAVTAVARTKRRVRIAEQVGIGRVIPGVDADLVEPQAVDGDVGGLAGGPGRGRGPGGPLGNVGAGGGGVAGAVARVDVAEGLGVGEAVEGAQVAGPVAVAAVGDVGVGPAGVDVAGAAVGAGGVGGVFGAVVGVDDYVTEKGGGGSESITKI